MSIKTFGVQFGQNWQPCLSAPVSVSVSQGVLCVEGRVTCEKPEALGKVRDDFYEKICHIGIFTHCGHEMLVGGSKTRGGIRLEPYRVCVDAGGQVSVRVIRGNRAPMCLHLENIIVPFGGDEVVLGGSVTCRRVGHWVFLTGQIEAANVGHTQLPFLIPQELRPVCELEFLVIHNGVSMARIYPDGRVVIDSGLRLDESAASTSSAVYVRKGSVWLSAIRWSVASGGDLIDVCGNRPTHRGVFLHKQAGLVLLQGKLQRLDNTLCSGPNGLTRIAHLPVAPATSLFFYVLKKISTSEINDRYTRVVIDTCGDVYVAGDDSLTVSLSGIIFAPNKPVGDPRVVLSLFESICTSDGWTKIRESILEGIADYAARVKLEGLDIDQVDRLLVGRLVASVAARKRAGIGPWAAAAAERDTVPTQWTASLAELVCEKLPAQWGLVRLMDRVKLLASKHVEEAGSMEIVRASVSRYSARASLLETMRFNGRKCMHQLKIAKTAGPDEVEELNEIVNWWHQWSSNDKHLTHSSLMGNQDIFTDTGKWTIPDDFDVQAQLFKYMAWIFKKGYDTFISEIQTPLFPLIEDLDMESTLPMNDTAQIDDMFTEQLFFIKERARALKIIYPHINDFTVYIYSSSGFNKSKGRWKSSFHLVWPDIIVNGHLAPIVRQTTVEYFIYQSAASTYFKRMQSRLVNHYEANIWENVFDQTTSNAANGLRMPFSNKASWIKTNFGTKIPSVENRHCFPKGQVRIVFTPREWETDAARSAGAERAMELILAAERRDKSELASFADQNTLVGDRTQYKQSDKNTIHRTSAFFAGMKSSGGDLREFFDVDAQWVETVTNSNNLSLDEVAKWIQRGSCRRNMAVTKLTEYDTKFVECYEQADLAFFEGHTIESLRETELWSKMTPVAQAGLKARFRKYLQAFTSSNNYVKTGMSDVARLALIAQKVPIPAPLMYQQHTKLDVELPMIEPPMDNEMEIEQFEYWPEELENIFSYHKNVDGFVSEFDKRINLVGGHWIHTPHSATYSTPKPQHNGWASCMQVHVAAPQRQYCTVAFYHHCGKVVVTGDDSSKMYDEIIKLVQGMCEPDDRLYHKLTLPDDNDDRFPLIDNEKASEQRTEYERRWEALAKLDQEFN